MAHTDTTVSEVCKTSLYLPRSLKKRLKLALAEHEINMTEALGEAIEMWLRKKELKTAA